MDGFYGLPISSIVALVVAVALGNENGGAVRDDHFAKAHGDHRKGQHALFEPGLLQAQQQPAPENKKGDGHINGDLAHLGGHKLLGHDHIQQPAQAHEYNVLIGNVPHTAQTAERHHQHQETVHIRETEGQVVGEVEGVPNKIHRIIVKAEQEKQKQEDLGLHCEVTIDGYTDFIFINRFGQAQHQATLNKAIRRIIRDCNDEQFLHSDEPDVLLPHFSCHSLRHTFTTRMCEAGVNIKVIQDALGHSDISTTLNIYADVTKEMKAEEFKGLDSYFKV